MLLFGKGQLFPGKKKGSNSLQAWLKVVEKNILKLQVCEKM